MHDRGLDQTEIVQIHEMLQVIILELFIQHQAAFVPNETLQQIRQMAISGKVVFHHVDIPKL